MRGYDLPVLVLLLACADCEDATFAAMTVEDPDGLGSVDAHVTIRSTIDQFARWTGEPGVCVPRAVIVPDVEDGLAEYASSDHEIHLEPVPAEDPYTTRHELCHAWDDAHDYPAVLRGDLFDASEPSPEIYPTAHSRADEAFVRVCEEGPQPTAMREAIEAACGEDWDGASRRWVNDQVYPAWGDPGGEVVADHEVTVERKPLYLAELLKRASLREGAVGGDGAAWMLGLRPVFITGDQRLVVERIDVATGAIVAELNGPQVRDGNWRLLGAEAGPLLVVVTDAGTEAWRVDAATNEIAQVAFPAVMPGGTVDAGAVLGDTAYVWAQLKADGKIAFAAVDLETGGWEELALPPAHGALDTVHGAHGALVAREIFRDELVWRYRWWRYDVATGDWTHGVLGTATHWFGFVPLPSGELLGTWSQSSYQGGTVHTVRGLAWIDPASDTIRVAADPCGEDEIVQGYLVPAGDGAAIVEYNSPVYDDTWFAVATVR